MSSGAIDRATAADLAQLRCAELFALSPSGRAEFRIQRRLQNFNSDNRNAHWSKKHKSMGIWQATLNNAIVQALGMRAAQALLIPESGLFGAKGVRCEERRRIEIIRWVPAKRYFVRDTFENLPNTAKELRDAIKKTGLIRDDSAKWTDTVIKQDVSSDGTFWTWIAIDRSEGA